MIVNSIFAVAKILGGVFGHAYVLIADGIESGLDIAGSFVIWSGLKVAARPPDATLDRNTECGQFGFPRQQLSGIDREREVRRAAAIVRGHEAF